MELKKPFNNKSIVKTILEIKEYKNIFKMLF